VLEKLRAAASEPVAAHQSQAPHAAARVVADDFGQAQPATGAVAAAKAAGGAQHGADEEAAQIEKPRPDRYWGLPKTNAGALASWSFVRSVVNFASLPTLI
jgi:hypothetical protein